MATATSVAVTHKPTPRRLSVSQSQPLISKECADPAEQSAQMDAEQPQSRGVHDVLPDTAAQWPPVSYLFRVPWNIYGLLVAWGANWTLGFFKCSGRMGRPRPPVPALTFSD